jgi:O-antigen/teichoic acid export membrane protein
VEMGKIIGRITFTAQKPLVQSLLWGTLAGGISMGMNFAINIMAARLLGARLGELSIFISVTAALQSFGLLGLNLMAVVLISKSLQDPEKLRSLISNIFTIVIYTTLAVSLVAVISNVIPGNVVKFWPTNSAVIIFFAAIWFFFSTLESLMAAMLTGFSSFRNIAILSLIKASFSLAVLYFLIIRWGVTGGIAGYAITFLFSSMLNGYYLKKVCNLNGFNLIINPRFDFSVVKSVLKVSMPVFLASVFLSTAIWICNYLVFLKPGGVEALSIYVVSNQWLILVQFFPIQISRVILPLLSAQHGSDGFKKTRRSGLILSMGIAAAIIAVSLILERPIIGLFHFDFAKTSIPLRILLFTGLLAAFNLYYGQTAISAGKVWIRVFADCVIAVALIVSVVITVNYNLILSLPLASLISYLAGTLTLLVLIPGSLKTNSN